MRELADRGHGLTVVSSGADVELCARPNVECSTVENKTRGGFSSKAVFEGYEWSVWGELICGVRRPER